MSTSLSLRKAKALVARFPDRLGFLNNREASLPTLPRSLLLLRTRSRSRKVKQVRIVNGG